MNTKMEGDTFSSPCLFCVTNLTPPECPQNGISQPPSFLPWKKENSAIHEQLKSFFILQKILKVRKETLCRFLRETSGQNHPDLWSQVQVCLQCGQLVFQYYQALKQNPRSGSALERIENKLRAKIHESQDDNGGQRSSLFWRKLRSRLITGDSPNMWDDNDSSTEYPQVSETTGYQSGDEDVYPGAVQVKIEEFDSRSPPFSGSEEEYNIGETEVKVEVMDSAPTSLPLSEDSSAVNVLHTCSHCPFKTYYLPYFELHLQAHLPGSSSTFCSDCGVCVLNKKLASHRYNHRLKARMKIARLEAKADQPAKKKRGKVPPPPYTLMKEKGRKAHYQCRDCPYKNHDSKPIQAHILLHQRSSGAIPCPDCSCYYPSDNLERHRFTHLRCHLPKYIRRVTPYKKEGAECPKCPFRNARKTLLKSHLELHEPGSSAEVCMECGVFVRSMEKHVMYCDKGIQDNSVVERSFPSRNTITKKMRDVDSSNPNYFSYKRGKMTYKMYQCQHCDFRTFRNLAGMETHVEEMHGKVEDSVAILEPELEASSSSLVEVKVEDATADEDDCDVEPKSGQVCNVGETVVKTEVVDLGHFSTPTFSIFEEEEEESYPIPILSEAPILTFELGSASDFCYRCPYCPFKHNFTRSFENHMPVHATGSNAVPCPDCGVYVFPENLVEHRKLDLKRALAPPKARKKSVRPKKEAKKTNKKEEKVIPPPDYSSHKEDDGKRGRIVYSCNHCPFTVKGGRSQIESHLKVHEPGSPAVPCEICRFFVYPERMNWHLSNRHHQQFKKACSKPKQKRPTSNPYFVTVKMSKCEFVQYPKKEHRCRKCPFKTLTYGKIAVHVKLHGEGSTAIPCEVCQEFVLPEQMELHLDTNHQDCVREEPEEINGKMDSV